jgi:heavy metal translocating P-type ATPase
MKLISFTRLKNDSEYRTIFLTVFSGIFLVLSFFKVLEGVLPFDAAWVSIVISGIPILKGAAIGLYRSFDIKAGALVSIALIAAVLIGEYFAAGEVAVIMMIGEVLENRTVRKARENVRKLIQLAPQAARIRTESGEKEIKIEDVHIGDILLVRPGESIPVDGIIVNGRTSINQSIISGESMPVDKMAGDEVFVGTINQLGVIEIKTTKVGEDTSLSKLIRLVRQSEQKKAPIERLSDRWATIIVPMALFLSIITFLFTKDITRAVTILVVFCPCALVLATPTAVMAGIGNASRKGILIKSGEALEEVANINSIVFDKTGTITNGKPAVTEIVSFSEVYSKDEILRVAAIAEKFSEHPLSKAIINKAKEKGLIIDDPDSFEVVLGQGVIATVQSGLLLVGNKKLMEEQHINIDEYINNLISASEDNGNTVMMVIQKDKPIGYIAVADQLKPESRAAVESLRKLDINDLLLVTGDNKNTAYSIAAQAGIKQVFSEQLPEGKVKIIEDMIREGKKVCMIGDGINDAPALAASNVGVSMGALGSDIAIETADIALMSDDMSKLSELILLSRKVISKIKINIFISMAINFGAIFLAAFGLMGPVMGALVHNAGSVLVVANSATLIKYRE